MNGTKWTIEEDEILKSYYGNMSIKDICNLISHRSIGSIRNRASYLGVTRGFNSVIHSFFSIPNNLNCYWAGFLAADGYVCEPNNSISFSLKHSDKNQLIKFSNDINFTGKVKDYNTMSRVFVTSNDWVINLKENFNIIQAKTFKLKPPNIYNEELCLSYITGYIDGDGRIGKYQKYKQIEILGTESILNWIVYWFDKISPVGKSTVRRRSIESNIFRYITTGFRAECIISKLKNIDLPRLDRKWN